MTPKRFERIEEIFHAAQELGLDQRAAFLDGACGGDNALRHEVESLLACKPETQSPLIFPVVDEAIRSFAQRDSDSLVGQLFGRYLMHERIGEGGMGEVWRAQDEQLKRQVAIKILPSEFSSDAERVRRFEQEAYAISALKHPNIITIHEIGHTNTEAGSLHYIVTELVEGQTLRELLAHGPLGWREAVRIAWQIAGALGAAHTAGIIHRDIKPENVILKSDGQVKLLDFGIAKWVGAPEGVLVDTTTVVATSRGATPGTLKYMSPEQARGEKLDERTDIFSLGLLLYEMIAGRHPYGDNNEEQLVAALKSDVEITPINAVGKLIPSALDQILSRALRKTREERYASASEMLADLDELRSLVEVSRQGKGQNLFRAQNANQLLTQFAVLYDADKSTRIPLGALWTIWRFADLKRGALERETIRKSWFGALMKVALLVVVVAAVTLAAAAIKSRAEVWEAKEMRDGHTAAVRQVAFSPDGRLLVSVGEDGKVIVWDFASRMPVAHFADNTNRVTAVDFSPDGKWFATGSEDRSVIIWDAASLTKTAVIDRDLLAVTALAFSPDGRFLAAASHEPPGVKGRITIWQVGTWQKLREFEARVASFGRLIFSSDSRLLSSTLAEKWNVLTGEKIKPDLPHDFNWIALSPDARRMTMVDGGNRVFVLDLISHQTRICESVHQDSGRAVAYSPNGRFVATGADDIILWDASTMTNLGRLEYPSIVWNLLFAPDGKHLVSTHGDGAILVWDVETRKLAANLEEHSGPVRGVSFSPDGKQIASASEDFSVIIWNAESGRKEAVLLGPTSRLTAVAFAPDGKHVAASEFTNVVTLWNSAQSNPERIIRGDSADYCVAISPDDRWIAHTFGVNNMTDGRPLLEFRNVIPRGQIYAVAFSADGKSLAAVSPFQFIAIFDTSTWQLRSKIESPDSQFVTVSFAPDNGHIVTGDDEGRVRLWEIDPLREVALLGRHSSRVKSVAFSPDGSEVASGGDDRNIRLWDVAARRLIATVGTHTAPVLSVAFSQDGKRLVSGGHDNSVRVFTRHATLWGYRLN